MLFCPDAEFLQNRVDSMYIIQPRAKRLQEAYRIVSRHQVTGVLNGNKGAILHNFLHFNGRFRHEQI
jgi:hypothetical protein